MDAVIENLPLYLEGFRTTLELTLISAHRLWCGERSLGHFGFAGRRRCVFGTA